MFDNLRVRARYIGLRVVGHSSFLFTDELAILEGDFPAEEAVALTDRAPVPFHMQGIAVTPFHGTVAISFNIRTPHRFHFTDMRAEEHQNDDAVFVFELPEEITLDRVSHRSRGSVESESIQRDGRAYTRWKVTRPSISHGYNMGGFHFHITGDPTAVDGTTAYMYALSESYEPNEVAAPIQVVEIPEVPALEHLHVSLAWMSESAAQHWPDFFNAWQHLGFNVVSTFPRYWSDGVPPEEVEAFLEDARSRGFKILYNESPFHVMVNRRGDQEEIYSQLPNGPSSNACPSYRGDFYQEEIERVGKLAAAVQPDYIFHDIELWYRGGREANACQRCVARLRESGLALDDFLGNLGVEMLEDMNESVRQHLSEAGMPMPTVAVYNIHAARPIYHFVLDFKKLYPNSIDMAQPSLYVRGSAPTVRERIRTNYDRIEQRNTIPWLSAGTYGEFEPHKLEPMILETLLNGARGITYYWYGDFDSALDWYYHARPLKLLAPHEQLLVDGSPRDLTADNQTLSYTGWGTETEMLLLVGNYQSSRNTEASIELPFRSPPNVQNLVTGEHVPTDGTTLRINVPAQEFRLYYLSNQPRSTQSHYDGTDDDSLRNDA